MMLAEIQSRTKRTMIGSIIVRVADESVDRLRGKVDAGLAAVKVLGACC